MSSKTEEDRLKLALTELKNDRAAVEEAIAALRVLASSRGRRRGRPPAWMTDPVAAPRRGRPPGSRNKPKIEPGGSAMALPIVNK